jgi:hypothetical protein
MKPSLLVGATLFALSAAHSALVGAQSTVPSPTEGTTAAAAPPPAQIPASAWPRQVNLPDAAVLVYQPQVSSWVDDRIEFRCVVALKPTGAKQEAFGVVFGNATTHVDKVTRMVALDNLTLSKTNFPTLPDRGAGYTAGLQSAFVAGVRTVALDRLKMSLAASGAKPALVAVANKPPRVIVSYVPAILVPIDGAPALRPVPGSNGFQRIINTRALIVKSASAPQFFMHVYDGWLMATTLDGPWTRPFIPPTGIDALAKGIAATGVVDLLDGGIGANPKPSLARAIPTIYATQVPAELINFDGQPDFVPIAGTQLRWASNTPGDVLQDTLGNAYYILLAGRWFRSATLTGPWTFVASNALSPDFTRIPPTSLAGAVLTTVSGTPQAQEAVIENFIPQTATVPLRNGPEFTPKFDGVPKFTPIAGTTLAHAANATAPVIQVGPGSFYSLAAGIWFTATQPMGPWAIATSVPNEIYSIPPSSSLFYATFVHIYGASTDVVHEGYTPGYLGAMIGSGGTVVYGTGYAYPSWVGNAWYATPATYGVSATPIYNPGTGYTYGFRVSLGAAAWSQSSSGGTSFHAGEWSSDPCCASASVNVYRGWGNPPAKQGAAITLATAGNVPPPQPTGKTTNATAAADHPDYISANEYYASLGQSATWQPDTIAKKHYADADGNVYRTGGGSKDWQQQSPSGWSDTSGTTSAVEYEAQARERAEKAGQAAGSYSISNTTRFSGDPNDGWSRTDAGNSSQVYNYNWVIVPNGIMAWNDVVVGGVYYPRYGGFAYPYYGGIGWGGRFGVY